MEDLDDGADPDICSDMTGRNHREFYPAVHRSMIILRCGLGRHCEFPRFSESAKEQSLQYPSGKKSVLSITRNWQNIRRRIGHPMKRCSQGLPRQCH
jgi:hypothetical protein